MLTSSSSSGYHSQYLQPDYFRSPSPTADARPSPLTLLAQTCNSIGRDSASSAASTSQTEQSKSTTGDDARTSADGTPPTHQHSPSESDRQCSSQDPPHTVDDSAAAGGDRASSKRQPSSPGEPRSSVPCTSSGGPSGTLSTDRSNRGPRSAPSPSRRSKSPSTPPPTTRYDDSKLTAEYVGPSSLLGPTAADPDSLYTMQYLAAMAAIQRQSAVCGDPTASLLPYLAAAQHQRLSAGGPPFTLPPASAAAALCGGVGAALVDRLKPGSCCADPRCSQCLQLNAAANSSRGGCVGCTQCGNHQHQSATSTAASTASTQLLAAGGHGAFAAALSALSRLPQGLAGPSAGAPSPAGGLPAVHTCNWLNPGGAYCGRRFSSVDELMQHLHTHCGTATADFPPTPPFPPAGADLHPVATGSIFAPLAVLYGASTSSAAGLSFAPQALVPPSISTGLEFLPGVQLTSSNKSASPSSLLRHQHQSHHGLASAAAAAAAARYHPYRLPPTSLLPPSGPGLAAAYPSSLAAYYGALCGIAPGSNGTVPPVRL